LELTKDEWDSLRSQFVTLKNKGRGKHPKYSPFAFTKQCIAMLSSVLRSKQAIDINIQIMRVFVKMRGLIASKAEILEKIEKLEATEEEQNAHIRRIDHFVVFLSDNSGIMKKLFVLAASFLLGIALLSGCGSQKKIEGYDCGCSIVEPQKANNGRVAT